MTDIALVWDDTNYRADVAVSGVDLLMDGGLRTAVIISLLTNRQAEPEDVIPDGSTDPRGWWGDLPISSDPSSWRGDRIGSRLWLLNRAKAIPETAVIARGYVQEALQWMLDDGVAQRLDITTQWISRTALGITVLMTQDGASQQFNLVWQATG